MLKSAHTVLCEVDSFLGIKDFQSALKVIRSARLSLKEYPKDQGASIYFAESQCFYHLGQYRQALIKLKTGLRIGGKAVDNLLYAHMKLHLGRIYQQLGKIEKTIEYYNESYVFFKRQNDSGNALKALNFLAGTHFLGGNLHQCCQVLKQAISHAEYQNLSDQTFLYKINLGRAYLWMGNLSECKRVIGRLPQDAPSKQAKVFALALYGQLQVWDHNYEVAEDTLIKTLKLSETYGFSRDYVLCIEFLGLNEYFAGNYDKAKEYYLDILGRDEITASASAQTLRMLTDVYIAQEDWEHAIETARKAEAAITKINERIELGALYRAYGQIRAHDYDDSVGTTGVPTYKDNQPGAHEYFHKSITLLREIGARYELALTYMTCGRSSVYTNEERLDHLRRARDLFIEMEVPKRVTQVEQEIKVVGRNPRGSDEERLLRRGNRSSQRHDSESVVTRESKQAPVIIAHSSRMREIISMADRIKDSDMTILLTGETGTGKDLMAEYIHKTSCRREQPFVSVNSAAIPEALLESELFGFRKGTYTGATTDKTGLIETADGGTFYFDEIGEIPQSIQVKLLRVLETKAVRPLGVTRSKVIDVRFIAATNLDLHQKMASGHFRRDLYYRLQEFMIDLPPLNQRRDDFPHLVRHFIGERFPLNVTDMAKLLASFNGYSWPGNVRELKAALGRSLALWDGGDIADLISCFGSLNPQIVQQPTEREQMIVVLDRNNGNIAKASRELGLPDSTLRYQLKKLGI